MQNMNRNKQKKELTKQEMEASRQKLVEINNKLTLERNKNHNVTMFVISGLAAVGLIAYGYFRS